MDFQQKQDILKNSKTIILENKVCLLLDQLEDKYIVLFGHDKRTVYWSNYHNLYGIVYTTVRNGFNSKQFHIDYAIINDNGLFIRHREDGPSYVIKNQKNQILKEIYYFDGKRHREDGPALIDYTIDNKYSMYYWYDDEISKEEWERKLNVK